MLPASPSRAFLRALLLVATVLLLAGGLPSGSVVADEPGSDAAPPPPAEGPDGTTPDDPDDLLDVPTTFTKEQVDDALTRGLQWLRKKQGENGNWLPGASDSDAGGLKGDAGGQAYGGTGESTAGSAAYPFRAGVTALALYTLLKCKVSPKDTLVKNGFAHLKSAKLDEPDSSYDIGMVLLAVCATADAAKSTKASEKVKPKLTGEYRGWAQKLVDALLQKRDKFKIRGWRYNHGGTEGKPGGISKEDLAKRLEGDGQVDLSGTQIATLALFAAHRVGIKVPPKVWEDILAYSMEQQDEDGPPVDETDPVTGKVTTYRARGFSYVRGSSNVAEGKPTGGMTACGIANVMMARFVLTDGGRKRDQWEKRPDSGGKWRGSWREGKPIPPGAKEVQASVYDGLAWLKANWRPFQNPGLPAQDTNGRYNHYWHYALERAMDLVGNQRLGDRIWYSDIGQELLNRQNPEGFWKDDSTPYVQDDFLDTCFSLLFLRRATKGNIPFPSVTGGSDEGPVDNR